MYDRKTNVQEILSFKPCYTKEEVIALFSAKEDWLVSEIFDFDIPDKDKVWVICQLLPPEPRQTFANQVTERAIRRVYEKSSTKWKLWADKWLSGKDRTRKSAAAAYAAAYAADAAAAYAAAYACAYACAFRKKEVALQVSELKKLVIGE